MRAVAATAYGPPEVLETIRLPRPSPGLREVLVRVSFIGVNPKDVVVRKGKFRRVTGHRFPMVLGNDIAGEVVEAGALADLSVGNSVFGMINDFSGGAYAEYVAIQCAQVATVPNGLDLKHAAAVPLAAQTALQALRDRGELRPGERVLINGASGGVGTFAVQIAQRLGAHVTAVCSERNLALCTDLGADNVIDYKATKLVDLRDRFDVFFDVFGNYRFDKVRHLLTSRGRYVHTIPSAQIFRDTLRTLRGPQRARLVYVRSRRADLEWLSAGLRDGGIRVVLDRVYPLSEAAAAHRYIETKRARGKVVLEVA
ncbi:MAG: NAD(P)-dependent alcohol dehydrogenase [Myxococcales bacterium]|nr:NAD(P)-dependent alcohol dehydrogenase [Myxococcales bacterium]